MDDKIQHEPPHPWDIYTDENGLQSIIRPLPTYMSYKPTPSKKISFHGIDSWSRPVYKVVDEKVFVGSCDKLFAEDECKETVDNYFSENLHELVYFGTCFRCEPCGTSLNFIPEII